MSEKLWEVWSGRSFVADFETLRAAEAFAKRAARIDGRSRDIRHLTRGWAATVRRDALGRVWVDVMDSALA